MRAVKASIAQMVHGRRLSLLNRMVSTRGEKKGEVEEEEEEEEALWYFVNVICTAVKNENTPLSPLYLHPSVLIPLDIYLYMY